MKKISTIIKHTIVLATITISYTNVCAQNDTLPQNGPYSFTLEQCLAYATANNYQRQNMLLDQQSAEESYSQSKNQRLPSVNASASESMSHTGNQSGVNFSGNIGVNASIPIYQGGSINNSIETSRLQSERTKILSTQYDDNLTIQILNQFLTALSATERQKYQESILKTSREELARGEIKYNHGSLIESDYLMLKAQYASNLTDSLNTAITLENALISLKKLMSMDVSTELQIVYPDTAEIDNLALLPQEDEILQMAMQHMPDIQLAKSTMEMADVALESSKAGRRPTVSGSAGISTGHSNFDNLGQQFSDRFSQSVGISVGYAIFDRGSTKLAITKSKIQQQQAQLDLAQAQLDISQTVLTQYKNVQLEYQRYLAYQDRKDAYAKSYDTYKKRYDLGSIMAVDLLQQQNNYIGVLNDYINAKYGFILNRKILDVYTGQAIK